MNWAAVLQWAGTAGVAAAISAIIAWPKTRGEGKAGEGSGKLSSAQAERARFDQYRETTDATITHLSKECTSCQTRLEHTEVRLGKADDRIRALETAIRVIVRVMDEKDPAQITEAIVAAQRLI